jgi:hypothetical protein
MIWHKKISYNSWKPKTSFIFFFPKIRPYTKIRPLFTTPIFLVAVLLQSILNEANQGLLTLPLEFQYYSDFLVIQYVDDTVIVLEASSRQLVAMKARLNSFGAYTGLKVNYSIHDDSS